MHKHRNSLKKSNVRNFFNFSDKNDSEKMDTIFSLQSMICHHLFPPLRRLQLFPMTRRYSHLCVILWKYGQLRETTLEMRRWTLENRWLSSSLDAMVLKSRIFKIHQIPFFFFYTPHPTGPRRQARHAPKCVCSRVRIPLLVRIQ
jgi:hypothetical protein